MFEDTGRTTERAPLHVFAELSRSLWPAPSSHRWHCQGQKSTLRSPGDTVNAESSTEDHSSTLSAQAHQAEHQVESMSGAPSRWLGSPHSLSRESGTAVNECGRGGVDSRNFGRPLHNEEPKLPDEYLRYVLLLRHQGCNVALVPCENQGNACCNKSRMTAIISRLLLQDKHDLDIVRQI